MEKAERYTDKAIVQVLDCTLLMCIVYTVLHMFSYFIDYFSLLQSDFSSTAILQIGKLKAQQDSPILSSFHVMLVEHMIQCRCCQDTLLGYTAPQHCPTDCSAALCPLPD